MKRWKKWLSYLMEIHVESAPSAYNPHLYVSISRGRYQLCTANAIYSYGDLYDNFSKSFDRLDLEKRNIQKVLILGFGLGSIPIMLEQRGFGYEYTAVEIDEEVLYLANKYAMPDVQSPIDFIQADASIWVQMAEEQYDMICMDVFLDNKVPSFFESEDFLEKLSSLLAPDGLLLYNRLAESPLDTQHTRDFYEDTFLKVFPKGEKIVLEANWMLVEKR